MLELGKAIRIVRQAKNLTVTDLATRTRVSIPYLSLLEKGEREPSLSVVRRLARALGVPSEALVILAQPRAGTLRTDNQFAKDLAESLRRLAEAEDALRQKLNAGNEDASQRP